MSGPRVKAAKVFRYPKLDGVLDNKNTSVLLQNSPTILVCQIPNCMKGLVPNRQTASCEPDCTCNVTKLAVLWHALSVKLHTQNLGAASSIPFCRISCTLVLLLGLSAQPMCICERGVLHVQTGALSINYGKCQQA